MRLVFVPPTVSERSDDGPDDSDEPFVRLVRQPKPNLCTPPLLHDRLLFMRDRFMAPGYVTADQVREGDRYEVSDGHRIEMCPAGGRGGRANLVGASVLDTDPGVKSAAIDTGFTTHPKMLRAPDISVGTIPDAPGWVRGAPPLAVEYADTGQDEVQLQQKIKELSAASTVYVWVVRMQEPRRVEVYERGEHLRTVTKGFLSAPGVLKNRVPVRALYDREAAHEATLRNLLQRKGYASLEDVEEKAARKGRREGNKKGRQRGHKEGLLEGQRRTILRIFTARFGEPTPEFLERLQSASSDALDSLTEKLATAATADDLFV